MTKFELQLEEEVVKFHLPESWDEVQVSVFENFNKIDLENENKIKLMIDMLVSLSDNTLTSEIIKKLDSETFAQIMDYINFANTTPSNRRKTSLKIDGDKYIIKNMNDLTMGEQISIEMITKEAENNVMLTISDLLCIICRKVDESGKVEEFDIEHMNRKEMFGKLKVNDVYGAILFFSQNNEKSNKNSNKSSHRKSKLKVIK